VALCGAAVLILALGCGKGDVSKPNQPGRSGAPQKAPGSAQTPAPAESGPVIVPAKPEPSKTEPPKAEPPKAEPAALAADDEVWVEDDLPAGANPQMDGDDNWTWVAETPAPKSGKKCHQSNTADGEHQHFFTGATTTLNVKAGDKLFAWVWLDAAATPTEVMLQWHENDSWEHRAYWGANSIEWGADGTESRQSMGALPAAGKWVRLEASAAKVGLEGKTVDGMAFTLFAGKAAWDAAGRTPAK
jgi:hypothetical protein